MSVGCHFSNDSKILNLWVNSYNECTHSVVWLWQYNRAVNWKYMHDIYYTCIRETKANCLLFKKLCLTWVFLTDYINRTNICVHSFLFYVTFSVAFCMKLIKTIFTHLTRIHLFRSVCKHVQITQKKIYCYVYGKKKRTKNVLLRLISFNPKLFVGFLSDLIKKAFNLKVKCVDRCILLN